MVRVTPDARPPTPTPVIDSDPIATGGDPGRGLVEAIHVTAAASEPMHGVRRIRAIAGLGLDGDRYATGAGHYSADPKVDRHVTLIEAEEIESLADHAGITLAPGETRRNVTTRGIRLNELVGRRFRIGTVECEGTRLCEPCQYLQDMLGRPVLAPLVHRAGLRARILSDGQIGIGDEVVVLD
ncbi:MAG: MOSC domain-containing protein [Chloroflexi bacterium]|nr:MOSC domain-containing protein [Chloroflexota bacterium]